MAWRVRPPGRTNSSPVFTQACLTEWRNKLLTVVVVARQTCWPARAMYHTAGVQRVRSDIFSQCDFLHQWTFGDDLASFEILREIELATYQSQAWRLCRFTPTRNTMLSTTASCAWHLQEVNVIWQRLRRRREANRKEFSWYIVFVVVIHIYHKRSKNIDKRPNRRQKITCHSQDQGRKQDKKPSCHWGTARARCQLNLVKFCTNVRRIALEKACNREMTFKIIQGH